MVNKATRTVAPAIAVTGVSTSVGITYTLAASDPPETANYDVYYKQGNHTLPADTSDTGFSGDSWTKVSGQGAGTGITIAYGSLTPDSGGYGYTLAAAARNANYHDSVSTAVLAPYTTVITLGIDRSAATAGLGWTFAGDVYTVQAGAGVTVTGNNTGSNRRGAVAASATGVNITLNAAAINVSEASDTAALLLNANASVTLTLTGASALSSGENCAGIQAPTGTSLTITGSGSLTATGGGGSSGGAGIGGGALGNGGTGLFVSGPS